MDASARRRRRIQTDEASQVRRPARGRRSPRSPPERSRHRRAGRRRRRGALAKRISIEVVTHGQAFDPFWGVFNNGVKAGAKDMGVTVNYTAPDTFDMVKMAQLIDAAVAKKPQRPRRLDPGRDGARAEHQEGHRRRDPGHLDELRLGRLRRPRHHDPRRPDRVPGRPSAPASDARPPASRTPSASTRKSATRPRRCAARASSRAWAHRPTVRRRSTGKIPTGAQQAIVAAHPGRPDHRRRPDPRADRRRAGAQAAMTPLQPPAARSSSPRSTSRRTC